MNDCVAGIVASLTADDNVGLRRKDIDDLSFAFIPPLGSDQNCIRHEIEKMGNKLSWSPPASYRFCVGVTRTTGSGYRTRSSLSR